MNFRTRRGFGKDVHIDVVPFIDTLLYLIIFFSLSLNFVATQTLKLRLPQAAVNEGIKEKRELRVIVDTGKVVNGYTFGDFSVDGKPMSFKEVEALIKSRSQMNKDVVVVIQADERVSQGEVVKVMDHARSSGIEKIAIATRPKEK